MSTGTDKAPLNLRLRKEAEEWEDGEPIKPLLLEAAEAIEAMAGRIALGEWPNLSSLNARGSA